MPRPGDAADFILTTDGLTKEFAGFVAVQQRRPQVRRGTIHALIGPNGAGKTTCFNLLTKFLDADARPHHLQWARHHGSPAGRDRPARARALLPDLGGVPASDACSRMSGSRCSASAATPSTSGARATLAPPQRARRGAARRRRAHRLRRTPAVELPYGRKRALEIATTLALDPEMMLLDEPTSGMTATRTSSASPTLIKRVAADRTVLMVEHNLSVVAPLRPHHRARPRRDPGRRATTPRCRANPRGDRSLYRDRPCLRPHRADGRSTRCVATCTPGTASRTCCTASTFDGRPRRGRHPARPQRRRQDDDPQVDHGPARAPARLDRASPARETIAPPAPPISPGSASAIARRSAASSPA